MALLPIYGWTCYKRIPSALSFLLFSCCCYVALWPGPRTICSTTYYIIRLSTRCTPIPSHPIRYMPIESDCSSLARGLLKYIKPVIMCTRPLKCSSSHILFLRLLLLRWLCSGNLLWQPATDYNILRDRWLPNMLYAYNRYPITITYVFPFFPPSLSLCLSLFPCLPYRSFCTSSSLIPSPFVYVCQLNAVYYCQLLLFHFCHHHPCLRRLPPSLNPSSRSRKTTASPGQSIHLSIFGRSSSSRHSPAIQPEEGSILKIASTQRHPQHHSNDRGAGSENYII